ncbi:MAG: HAMP domain-containing sensor histidine kinase [Pseudomonadota bacterium]
MTISFEPPGNNKLPFQHAVNSGLIDLITFDSSGHIIQLEGKDLLNISAGKNLFDDCPLFAGLRDQLNTIIDENNGQFVMPAISLPHLEVDEQLDVRISHAQDPGQFILVATATQATAMPHIDGIRSARQSSYNEQLLKLERQRFKNYYESNPVLCFALDPDFTPIAVSNALKRFATNKTDQNIDLWISDFLASVPDLKNNSSPDIFICSAVRHDGSIRIVEVAKQNINNPVKEIDELFFVVIDITQRESALRMVASQSENLYQLNSQLEKSNQRLEDFARIAAHDLVAPLGRMAIFSEILQEELDVSCSEKAHFALNAIASSSERCHTVVNDILEMSRIDGIEPNFELLDIEEIFQEIMFDLEFEYQFLEPTFDLALERVYADRKLLKIILRNIVGNSIKYRKENTGLEISVKCGFHDNSTACLSIADNGKGFTIIPGKSVFTAFTRMSNVGTVEGSGLGLAIVKNACAALNWTPQISSEPSEGTTITLCGIELATGELINLDEKRRTLG